MKKAIQNYVTIIKISYYKCVIWNHFPKLGHIVDTKIQYLTTVLVFCFFAMVLAS